MTFLEPDNSFLRGLMIRVTLDSRPLIRVLLGTQNAICVNNARKVLENGDTRQMINCPKKSQSLCKISHTVLLSFTLYVYIVLHFRKSCFPAVTEINLLSLKNIGRYSYFQDYLHKWKWGKQFQMFWCTVIFIAMWEITNIHPFIIIL